MIVKVLALLILFLTPLCAQPRSESKTIKISITIPPVVELKSGEKLSLEELKTISQNKDSVTQIKEKKENNRKIIIKTVLVK